MKVPEHITLSFLLAQFGVQQEWGSVGTGLLIAAGCLPDLDGLGIVLGWGFYRRHHRILGHGLPLTVAGPVLLALAGTWFLGSESFLTLWAWCQIALFAHLLTDVLFYNWPVKLLWPVSRRGWAGGLLTWNDLTPTLLLYGGTLVAMVWPAAGPEAAALAIGGLAVYLGWRAFHREPQSRLADWLAGGWTERVGPFWRWLTGDFLP